MPKRSAEEKIEKYLKKLQKWIKPPRISCLNSSDSETENCTVDVQIDPQGNAYQATEENDIVPSESNAVQTSEELAQAPSTEDFVETPGVPDMAEIPIAEDTTSNPDLDPNILAALGEIVDDSPEFGEKIHDNLAKIWTPLLKKGMTKEVREKINKEYLIPENCPLLKSPALNPEIMAAIPETGRFRDKKISASQQQLGVGIAAVSKGLNSLLTADNKITAIKYITEGCRLLSDLHYQQTETRKKFITPSLDKSFLQLINVTERDDTLFGNKLSEKIKASKAIATQSKQIKKNISSTPKPSTSQPATRASNQGNWQGPPRFSSNRGGRGGFKRHNQRAQQPAPPPAQTQSQANTYQTRSRGTARQTQHP